MEQVDRWSGYSHACYLIAEATFSPLVQKWTIFLKRKIRKSFNFCNKKQVFLDTFLYGTVRDSNNMHGDKAPFI